MKSQLSSCVENFCKFWWWIWPITDYPVKILIRITDRRPLKLRPWIERRSQCGQLLQDSSKLRSLLSTNYMLSFYCYLLGMWGGLNFSISTYASRFSDPFSSRSFSSISSSQKLLPPPSRDGFNTHPCGESKASWAARSPSGPRDSWWSWANTVRTLEESSAFRYLEYIGFKKCKHSFHLLQDLNTYVARRFSLIKTQLPVLWTVTRSVDTHACCRLYHASIIYRKFYW